MAISQFIRISPAPLLSRPIRPAVQRGQLVHVVVGVAYPSLRRAMCEWTAIDAEVDRRSRRPGGAS